ncbi:uncharacterized protein LOC121390128 [Gigantopelta aegis]|uniref:uncharacterized protein LOC121390128 n=1 Tax=Gigantopelta aegis TaxID=1735272 RepID=UPI001B88BF19|nr:uncharacterized protein LOC121390128 [Gigantopelta aegis]
MHFCVFLAVLVLVSGSSLDLTGSSSHAVLGESFTFTCTVKQAVGLVNAVYFSKATSSRPLGTLYQKGNSCILSAIPKPGYFLSCGSGTDISSSSTKNYTLKINRAAHLDATDWWCGQNKRDRKSSIFRLQLYYGPHNVALDPASTGHVTEGDSLTVNCTAQCNPSPCSFSWTVKNDTVSSGPLLSLTDISLNKNGSVYVCTVNNTAIQNSTTIEFTLIVKRSSLDLAGSSSHAVLGESFTFTCTVKQAVGLVHAVYFRKTTSSSALGTLYQKGDSCVLSDTPKPGYFPSCGSGTDISSSSTKNYTLKINRAAHLDATDWFCGLGNGEIKSSKFRLQLYYGPQNVALGSASTEGDSLTVNCTGQCKPSPCSFSWTVKHDTVSSGPLLSLTGISSNMNGNVYICNVTNTAIQNSKIIGFQLMVKALLFITGSSSHAVLGESFIITCTVKQAVGLVNAVYFRKTTSLSALGTLYQKGDRCVLSDTAEPGYFPSCGSGTDISSSITKNYTLKINRTAHLDATDWWCGLSNTAIKSSKFKLQLYYGPHIVALNPASTEHVREGDSLSVNCTAQCNPSPCSFSWTVNNDTVSSGALLSLPDVSNNMNGSVYMCTANNTVIQNSTTIEFTLIVTRLSLDLTGSSSHAVLGKSVTFTCTVKQAVGLVNAVYFRKTTSSSALGTLYQKGDSCVVSDTPKQGYVPSCGSGTDISSSSTKNYTLKINRTAHLDATDWWCELSNTAIKSSKFKLQLYYGPHNVALDPASTGHVTEGDSLTVNCTAQCNPSPCSFSWTVKNDTVSSGALLSLTDISRNKNGSVYVCTVNNTAIQNSTTIEFTLIVTDDPKRTSSSRLRAGPYVGAGPGAAISGIVVAVLFALAIPTVWIIYSRKIKKQANDGQNESNK